MCRKSCPGTGTAQVCQDMHEPGTLDGEAEVVGQLGPMPCSWGLKGGRRAWTLRSEDLLGTQWTHALCSRCGVQWREEGGWLLRLQCGDKVRVPAPSWQLLGSCLVDVLKVMERRGYTRRQITGQLVLWPIT